MSRVLDSYISEYNKRQTRRRKLAVSLVCVSIAVFFTVVELLKVPGISLAGVATNASVAVNKTIDRLDDGNPDTDLTGSDFYRLYLTAEGVPASNAVDLLIVVDQSGTMFENADIVYDGANQYRDCVIGDILNGSAYVNGRVKPDSSNPNYDRYADNQMVHCTATEDGLINQFLSLDSRNKVAVIGFNADRRMHYQDGYPAYANEGYGYTKDSDILLPWTGNKITGNGVNTTAYCFTGTNYHAALMRADDMFNDSSIVNDGNVKVMIFFSDGVPTCYIGNWGSGDRCGSTMSGTISSPETQNIMNCRQPSLDCFNSFVSSHPDVICYAVGISDELAETDSSATASGAPAFSDFVLKQYVHQVDGKGYYYSGRNGDQLREDMMALAMNNSVQRLVITDKLSQYVQYYSDNADVKVTMIDTDNNETILYDDGVTEAGRGIISQVKYTPVGENEDASTTTGTIEAIFDPDYGMRAGYQYTLSYNVVLTETAYATYIQNSNGYGDITGDSGTDYGTNASSSGQGGLYSNKEAYVEYKVGTETHTKDDPDNVYDHPVVQINTKDITVNKVWLNSDNTTDNSSHSNVTVQLYREILPIDENPNLTPTPAPTPSGSLEPDGWKHADSFISGRYYVLKNARTGEVVKCADYNAEYHSLQYDAGIDITDNIPLDCIWTYRDGTLADINGNPMYITSWSSAGGDNQQVWCGSEDSFTNTSVVYDNGKIKVYNNNATFYLNNNYNSATTYDDGDLYIVYQLDGSSGYNTASTMVAGHTYLIKDNETNKFITLKLNNQYHSLVYDAAIDINGSIPTEALWTYTSDNKLTDADGNPMYLTSWGDHQVWCASDNGFTDCTIRYINGKIEIRNNNYTRYLNASDNPSSSSDGGHSYTLYEMNNSYSLIYEPIPTPTEAPQPSGEPGNEEPGVAFGNPVSFGNSYTFEDLYMQGYADGKVIKYRYYVKEVSVPSGYTVSYSEGDNGELIVTNKDSSSPPTSPTPTDPPTSPTPTDPPTSPTPTDPPTSPTPTDPPTSPTPTDPPTSPTPTDPPTSPTPTDPPTSPTPTENPPTPTEPPTPIPSPEPGKFNLEVNKIWRNSDNTPDTSEHGNVTAQLYRELSVITPEPTSEPTATPTPTEPWVIDENFEAGKAYILMESGTGKVIQEKPYEGEYHSFLYPTDIDLDGNIPSSCVFTYNANGKLTDENGNAFYITSWSRNGSGNNVNKQVWCGSDDSYTDSTVSYIDGKIKITNGNQTFYLTGEDQASDTPEGGSDFILYPVTYVETRRESDWKTVPSFQAGHTYVLWNEDYDVAAAKNAGVAEDNTQYQDVKYTTNGLNLSDNVVPDVYKWTYNSDGSLTNGAGDKAFVPSWSSAQNGFQLWCGGNNGYSNTTVEYNNGKLHFTNSNRTNVYLTNSSSGANNANGGHNYSLYEYISENMNCYSAVPLPPPPSTPTPTPTPSIAPQYDNTAEAVGDEVTFISDYTFVNLEPQGTRDDGWTYIYSYYVEEVTVPEGYLVSYENGEAGDLNIINSKDPNYVPPPTPTPTPPPINITVKKVWEDNSGEIAPIKPVTVQLYRNAVNASAEVGNIHITDIAYGEPFELSTVNDCEYVIRDLPIFGTIGGIDVNFSYYAVEINEGEVLYEVSYSHDSDTAVSEDGTTLIITNKLNGIYGYELPNTGGTGILGHFIIGSILTTSTTLLLIFTRKRRERGDFSDSG